MAYSSWHVAFGVSPVPAPAQPAHPPALNNGPAPAPVMFGHVQRDSGYSNMTQNMTNQTLGATHEFIPQQMQNQQQSFSMPPGYDSDRPGITPSMWREAVASVSSAGIKKRWNNAAHGPSGITKRPR